MARWLPVSNMWQDCHFVLTRAGFLHWFHDTENFVRPLDCLNLARCQFEAGEAPTFNLVENNTGRLWFFSNWVRTIAFKASTVEECCEWAIALREAIATARGDDRTHWTHYAISVFLWLWFFLYVWTSVWCMVEGLWELAQLQRPNKLDPDEVCFDKVVSRCIVDPVNSFAGWCQRSLEHDSADHLVSTDCFMHSYWIPIGSIHDLVKSGACTYVSQCYV